MKFVNVGGRYRLFFRYKYICLCMYVVKFVNVFVCDGRFVMYCRDGLIVHCFWLTCFGFHVAIVCPIIWF